jgi:retron-type reverse transcriptase
MKRFNELYSQIYEFPNLYLAFQKAARGKRSKEEVAAFEYDVETQLFQLQEELQSQTYQPGPYRSFTIHDPKRRLISAAPFRDRVVHHALCNIIEPIYERVFIGDSFANRIGKGNHRALDSAQYFSRKYKYVLQCDIQQYFPSIDHPILLNILERKIRDEKVVWLCGKILKSGEGIFASGSTGYFPGDDLFSYFRPRGLPIGNLTSQFWGNVYLNELDQRIKRKLHCKAYLRYVDDFLLFSNDKKQLWDWKEQVIAELQKLRLVLHEERSTVVPCKTGIPFLGFRIFPQYRRLKRKNGIAFQRRFHKIIRAYNTGKIDFKTLNTRVQGWVAHARHGNTWMLRKKILTALSG